MEYSEGFSGQLYEQTKASPDVLLSTSDKEVIEHGLEVLTSELLKREKLPKVFVYPAVSAVPLVHAVLPVTNAVYRERGVENPYHVFLQIPERLKYKDEIALEFAADGRFLDISSSEIVAARRTLADIRLSRGIVAFRAAEIISKCHLEDGDSVMVIDGFMSEYKNTYTEIKDGFVRSELRDKNILPPSRSRPTTLARFIQKVKRKGPKINLSAFAFEADPQKPTRDVLIGSEVRNPKRPWFAFQGEMPENDTRSVTIGYEKTLYGFHMVQSSQRDPDAMSLLRATLRRIGEEVVERDPNLK